MAHTWSRTSLVSVDTMSIARVHGWNVNVMWPSVMWKIRDDSRSGLGRIFAQRLISNLIEVDVSGWIMQGRRGRRIEQGIDMPYWPVGRIAIREEVGRRQSCGRDILICRASWGCPRRCCNELLIRNFRELGNRSRVQIHGWSRSARYRSRGL